MYPSDDNQDELQDLWALVHLALAKAGGATGGGEGFNFVWDPLQARHDNVFPAWPALAAAIAEVQGQKTVTVANATLCHITAGTWPGITDVTFVGGESVPLGPQVTLDAGAILNSCFSLTLDGVVFLVAGNGSNVIDCTGTDVRTIKLRNDAHVAASGTSTMLTIEGTSTFVGICDTGFWDAGTIATGGTSTADFLLFNASGLAAGAITGATGTVSVALDATSLPLLSRGFATGGVSTSVDVIDPPSSLAIDTSGTPAGNGIYTSWDSLTFARSLIDDPVTIQLYSDVHVPSGTWNLGFEETTFGGFQTLTFDQGAVISPTNGTFTFRQCTVINDSTVSPWTLTSVGMSLTVEDFATVTCNVGKAALIHDTAAAVTLIIEKNGTVGDGVTAVLKSDTAPGTAVQIFDFGTLLDNALATAAGGSYEITRTLGATLNMPLVQNGSTILAYVCLDIVNTAQQTGNTGSGSHTVTVTTGNIVQKKSGKVLVHGSMAGTSAVADTITATLVRDVAAGNVTIATQTVTTTATQLNYNVSFAFLDTLPDFATHTYSIRLAGSQNNTVAANQGIITAIEQ
jgi:hypothetical protein